MIPVCRWDIFILTKDCFNFLKCCIVFQFFKIDQSPALHLGITSQMTSVRSADLSSSGTTLAK
jgi:hypothetical protein